MFGNGQTGQLVLREQLQKQYDTRTVLDPSTLEKKEGRVDESVRQIETQFNCIVTYDWTIEKMIHTGATLIACQMSRDEISSSLTPGEKLSHLVEGAVIFILDDGVHKDGVGACVFQSGMFQPVISAEERPSPKITITRKGRKYIIGVTEQKE